ncbi:MAG: DUF559 domain-containing protein [Sphingomonadales bacterium]|nr:DUF559 domain-containing protein [Sphingomonadales bacterium]MBU3993254.1 DUF559 domain-containing protein [Alphaproteobacteria bacterium]
MRKTLSVSTDQPNAPATGSNWGAGAARLERLKERARFLRRNLTAAEELLWSRLSGAQLGGLKFSPKAVVGSVIVDFACPARWLVVSITGAGVNPQVDALLDRKLTDTGIRVLRFTEQDVTGGLDDVVRAITAMTNAPFDRPRGASGSAARRERIEG